MKLNASDMGVCGDLKAFYVGSVAFDTDNISSGIEIFEAESPMAIVMAAAVVTEAFNAATTNVLTVGSDSGVSNVLGASDITEGTKGAYGKANFITLAKGDKVKVKYTQTGTAATEGAADIYFVVTALPE